MGPTWLTSSLHFPPEVVCPKALLVNHIVTLTGVGRPQTNTAVRTFQGLRGHLPEAEGKGQMLGKVNYTPRRV